LAMARRLQLAVQPRVVQGTLQLPRVQGLPQPVVVQATVQVRLERRPVQLCELWQNPSLQSLQMSPVQ